MNRAYLQTERSGELSRRIEKSREMLTNCNLCPRNCGVNRLAGELGKCGLGEHAEVASYGPHFGEESVLVGESGSGTIFFCGCNLRCVFCQNYDLSHPQPDHCQVMDADSLAELMLGIQQQGCHNINFVTPSHLIPQILAALQKAIEGGLRIPLVYNTGAYDHIESLRLLEGIIDIYMPDFKFWQSDTATRYCDAPDYRDRACDALIEMQRQVGDLQMDNQGVAERGLLVRHLLMPEGQAETEAILDFIGARISLDCYVNIMDQYRPCGRAYEFSELERTIEPITYRQAMVYAKKVGLTRLDQQDLGMLVQRLFAS